MANFKTHLSIGSAVGFILATFAYVWSWVSTVSQAITVFLITTFASFVPDMDSDSGLPVKIIFTIYGYFVAGYIIYFSYNQNINIALSLILAAAGFFIVYFLISRLFQKYTRHRGIFHSIPAALISFFLTLLLLQWSQLSATNQFAIAFGVFVGYLTHLILDEIYAFEFITTDEGKRYLRKKRSFGTALDFGFSSNQPKWEGLVAWALVFILFLVTLPAIKKIYFAFLY